MKTPGVPRRGKDVKERGISFSFKCLRAKLRLTGNQLQKKGNLIKQLLISLKALWRVRTGIACLLQQRGGHLESQSKVFRG